MDFPVFTDGQFLTNVAESFVGLALLVFGYGYMYRHTKVDRFREDMFTLRDELFDYMWKHDLPYSHPAYLNLRAALNGSIRFGTLMSLPVFALLVYYAKRDRLPNTLGESIRLLPDEHQVYFDSVRRRSWGRLMTFLFREGIVGWVGGKLARIALWLPDAKGRIAEQVTDEFVAVGASHSNIGRALFQC